MTIKLAIRGIIVGASYGTDHYRQYIDRGVITPENVIRETLEAATAGDVELIINSVGGSVFAAYDMANALRDYTARTGAVVTGIVGGVAASSASAVLLLGCQKILVHSNSKIMFHSAAAATMGGPEAHQDRADLLDKINAEIKAALVAHTNFDVEQIEQWFAEGRAGWVTAREAVDAKLADSMIDAVAPRPVLARAAITQLSERGMQIAALAVDPELSVEAAAIEDDFGMQAAQIAELTGNVATATTERDTALAQLATATTALADAESAHTAAQATTTARIGQLETDLAAAVTASATAESALATAQTQVATLERTIGKLTPGLLNGGQGAVGAGPASFREAIAEIRAENPSIGEYAAWEKAKAQYPQLWEKSKK